MGGGRGERAEQLVCGSDAIKAPTSIGAHWRIAVIKSPKVT